MDLKGISVSSYIPGRIRLKAQPLKGNPDLARRVTELLSAIQGIDHVGANPLTGSLLVFFTPAVVRSPESVRLLGEAIRTLDPRINAAKIDFWLQKLPF